MVFASLPLIYKTFAYEAKKDLTITDDRMLVKNHFSALGLFMYLFLGFVVALALWYVFLPSDVVYDLFSSQISTIEGINNRPTGSVTSWNFLSVIVTNNLKVLTFCILFSFFYGAGALFILAWNASVISTAMGTFVRNGLSEYIGVIGFAKVAAYFQIFSLALLRYMTHGIFEILAYFIGGLAGGLISIAMLNHKFQGEHFKLIIKDAVDLIILAILITLMAGLVEVFITPLMFA